MKRRILVFDTRVHADVDFPRHLRDPDRDVVLIVDSSNFAEAVRGWRVDGVFVLADRMPARALQELRARSMSEPVYGWPDDFKAPHP